MRLLGRVLFVGAVSLSVLCMTAWGGLAIYYSDLPGETLRTALAAGFGLGTAAAFLILPNRRRTLAGFLVAFGLLLGWWLSIAPRNDRDWQADVAVLPAAAIDGDRVTIRNIRNFQYGEHDEDFVPRYYDKTFDLRTLDALDLIAVYWMGDAIAHIMLSFGFGGEHVTFSIETRKERGESYSSLAGFFKQFELIYVVGDERDLIGVRTTYRRPPEDVYVYRTRAQPDAIRRLFLEYVDAVNRLTKEPAWYNTLTTNCTTAVFRHVRIVGHAVPRSWKILLSGYVPEYVYERGTLDRTLPFPELRRRSLVNERARAAGRAEDFSRRIREGLPRPL
jgi:hypothetical protein